MTVSATPPSRAERPEEGARRAEARGRFEDALARARGQARPDRGGPAGTPTHAASRPPGNAPPQECPGDPGRPGLASPTVQKPDAPSGICELQAALRAAPPAIAAAARQGAPQLALDFGSALSIDLRTGAQGLELSLRPAPALERAARAELPRLVEALRARGLRLARADVRANPATSPASRAR